MRKSIKNSAGFTLLEMLIVMGIFMLVLIPVFNVFDNSYKSYIVQEDVSAVQQNVRVGTVFMRRDIRMAGSGMEGLTDLDNVLLLNGAPSDGKLYGLEYENGTGPNGSDKLVVRYIDPFQSDCSTGCDGSARICSELPDLITEEKFGPNSAEVEIMNDANPLDVWEEPCCCGGTTSAIKQQTPRMAVIISPDGKKADLFYLTHVQPPANKAGNNKVDGFDNKVAGEYPGGSTIRFFDVDQFVEVQYYLNGKNELIRELNGNPQPLSESIEDLQFAMYGDFNGDGNLDMDTACADNSDCINDASLLNDARAEDVRIVRMGMVGRTDKHSDLPEEARPALEDNPAGNAGDPFLRRVIQAEYKIRNAG